MDERRGPFIGHQTKPQQLRASLVTIEYLDPRKARVQGVFDVAVPGAEWRERPAYGDLEAEIEVAIGAVLIKHAKRRKKDDE